MTDFASPASSDPVRIAVDHLLEGIQIVGRDWTYKYLNATAARHVQRRTADLLGRTMMECFPGIEATPLFERLKTAMALQQTESFRSALTLRSGERRWFDPVAEPVPGGGLCVLSLDVTEQHRLETEVREHDERRQFALRGARMGMWQVSIATGQIVWSDTIRTLVDVPPGTGPKTTTEFLNWVDPQDRDRVARALDRVIGGGHDEFEAQFRLVTPQGRVHWIDAHGRVMTGPDGRRDRLIGIGADVTARRQTAFQLHQAQKMEAIGRLAGGIAHDFNNQLTAVLGFCDLALAAAAAGSSLAADLQEIRNAGERAAAITRHLLAFSRQQVLNVERIDVNDLVARLARLLARLIGDHITVRVECDAAVPAISGDVSQFENILTNLAVNARDAMPTGGTLVMRTAVSDCDGTDPSLAHALAPGRYVTLAVEDTGHGMDEATRLRVFEPFFTTKDAGKGTGLGLSTVYGIVQQMDGSIAVSSRVGAGSTFVLYFPIAAAQTGEDAGPAADGVKRPAASPIGAREAMRAVNPARVA